MATPNTDVPVVRPIPDKLWCSQRGPQPGAQISNTPLETDIILKVLTDLGPRVWCHVFVRACESFGFTFQIAQLFFRFQKDLYGSVMQRDVLKVYIVRTLPGETSKLKMVHITLCGRRYTGMLYCDLKHPPALVLENDFVAGFLDHSDPLYGTGVTHMAPGQASESALSAFVSAVTSAFKLSMGAYAPMMEGVCGIEEDVTRCGWHPPRQASWDVFVSDTNDLTRYDGLHGRVVVQLVRFPHPHSLGHVYPHSFGIQ